MVYRKGFDVGPFGEFMIAARNAFNVGLSDLIFSAIDKYALASFNRPVIHAY